MEEILFNAVATFDSRAAQPLLAIPFWEGGTAAVKLDPTVKRLVADPLALGDFKASVGDLCLLYPSDFLEERIVLVGLGKKEELSCESLRSAYGTLAAAAKRWKVTSMNIWLPSKESARPIAEGLCLASYSFSGYRSSEEKPCSLKSVSLIDAGKEELAKAKEGAIQSEGVAFAKDLINGNADDITPQAMAAAAHALAKKWKKVTAKSFDKKRIEKEKMGLLLAVARGASVDPAFIIVSYQGDPKSKEHTVIVGKGVTYDTGGLNMKPTGRMETMKRDMSGGAVALGVIANAAALDLKVNVTAVVPSAENSVSDRSYKPGDVYIGYDGKSVEIGNTDAEGRLLLADALAYSVKNLNPTRLIDIATLTGAIVVALGREASGLFCNDDALAALIEKAGNATGERVWRLPLFKEYRKQLDSDIADLRNIGGQGGGSSVAAVFLQEFTSGIPWAHLDIAGTAYKTEGMASYESKYATGVGVRLLTALLEA